MKDNYSHKDILLSKAKEDFLAAKKIIEMTDYSEEIVLFHCQQSIEKALKAYLDSKNIKFPKTHDLEILLSKCIEKDSTFEQIEYVTSLTVYAIESRYDEIVQISQEEMEDIIAKTEDALDFILGKIDQKN